MIHNFNWICDVCKEEIWLEEHHVPGKCVCGGAMTQGGGEEYDQEFVDEEKYRYAKEKFDDRWRR